MGSCCVESQTKDIRPYGIMENSKDPKSAINYSDPTGSTNPNFSNPPSDSNTRKQSRQSFPIKQKIYSINDFKKGKLKGKGRFGKVYEGLCIYSGEFVAIKTISNLNKTQKENVIKSLQTLYQLQHTNIINVLHLYDGNSIKDEELNVVYEFCNGSSLRELINKYGTFDEKIIQLYLIQVLAGLEYLHINGIIHKNLTLNNILVDSNGTIRISDSLIDSVIMGSGEEIYRHLFDKNNDINYYIPSFFIKEKGKILNQSFDFWYLGCALIEISTGKTPWSDYSFNSKEEFLDFLSTTLLVPAFPRKLSQKCKEFLSILFDPIQTSRKDIYSKLYSLDFFNIEFNDSNLTNNCDKTASNIRNSQVSQNIGVILQKGNVVNINNGTPTFSVTISSDENVGGTFSFEQSRFQNNSSMSSRLLDFGRVAYSSLKTLKSIKNRKDKNNNWKHFVGEICEVEPNLEQSPLQPKDNKNIYNFDSETLKKVQK